MTRYIYLRSLPCQVKAGIYLAADLPVGCLAYKDLEDGTFAFGLSFFDSVAQKTPTKKEARDVARERLTLALQGDQRKFQQGRWGFVTTNGSSLNECVSSMIKHIIEASKIHGNVGVRERVILQLQGLQSRLITRQEAKSA